MRRMVVPSHGLHGQADRGALWRRLWDSRGAKRSGPPGAGGADGGRAAVGRAAVSRGCAWASGLLHPRHRQRAILWDERFGGKGVAELSRRLDKGRGARSARAGAAQARAGRRQRLPRLSRRQEQPGRLRGARALVWRQSPHVRGWRRHVMFLCKPVVGASQKGRKPGSADGRDRLYLPDWARRTRTALRSPELVRVLCHIVRFHLRPMGHLQQPVQL
mmetsp:Transcript_2795/g.6671  ORF Transcript_2795/g.6671 Transcript_2795/m.6671 type:complete len:218 (+) Transcript_2795:469-1122(+)